MQQNAQTLNVNITNSVLHKAKPEILRGVELLIDKMQNEMSDLLVEVRIHSTDCRLELWLGYFLFELRLLHELCFYAL